MESSDFHLPWPYALTYDRVIPVTQIAGNVTKIEFQGFGEALRTTLGC